LSADSPVMPLYCAISSSSLAMIYVEEVADTLKLRLRVIAESSKEGKKQCIWFTSIDLIVCVAVVT